MENDMPEADFAQIYLASPTEFDLATFGPRLAAVLDAVPVACVRIALATTDEAVLGRAADQLRDICHAREVAIVVDEHFRMVEKHGLDGVHLVSSSRNVREARKELGEDAIIGTYCGNSKHAGMTAAEIGIDYICFGPVGDMGGLGDGARADVALFQWWSEMIEVPVVAEGGMDEASLRAVRDHVDFVTFGSEIWQAADAATEAVRLLGILKGA
jgi:thiamine-phosphate pyrophosphorylase